jgi:pantetheine-phosphate adenylyltransferase
MRIAVYPGSFDPITNGHVDVLRRAAAAFDRVVVAVLVNPRKATVDPADERVETIRASIAETLAEDSDRIEVVAFDGLTVDLCRRIGARWLIRGLRAVADFEAELQMAHMNRKMAPEVDTVFFMTALEHAYLSSSLVREIARFGGDVAPLVPNAVLRRLAGDPPGGSGASGPAPAED